MHASFLNFWNGFKSGKGCSVVIYFASNVAKNFKFKKKFIIQEKWDGEIEMGSGFECNGNRCCITAHVGVTVCFPGSHSELEWQVGRYSRSHSISWILYYV